MSRYVGYGQHLVTLLCCLFCECGGFCLEGLLSGGAYVLHPLRPALLGRGWNQTGTRERWEISDKL